MSEKFSPCLEKDCSFCCNPVKVKSGFPEDKIPIDENGEKIWNRRDEIYVPETETEKIRLETFDCVKYDKETGKCMVYEKRPDICRQTSCVQEDSEKTVDEQHKRTLEEKFIVTKKEKGNQ